MTYKNILVAVDTTDEAEDVFRVAREVAEKQSAKVSAVTVIRPMADFYSNLYSSLEGNPDTDFAATGLLGRRDMLQEQSTAGVRVDLDQPRAVGSQVEVVTEEYTV